MGYDNFFAAFIKACKTGADRGWHRCGGGSLSMRLDFSTLEALQSALDLDGDYQPIGTSVPGLGREFFLVTAGTSLMQEAFDRPDEASGIIQISPDGSGWRTVLGFLSGAQPMGDLGIHLLCHEKRCSRPGTPSVIYHSCPMNLIALTYLVPLEDEAMSRLLRQSFFQCNVLLPDGVGVISPEDFTPLYRDGDELEKRGLAERRAAATTEKFGKHRVVIWPHCGMICAAGSVIDAVRITEAVEMAAEIRLKLMQNPGGIRQEPEI